MSSLSTLDSESIKKDSSSYRALLCSLKFDSFVEKFFNSMLLKGNLRQFPCSSVES